MKRAFVHFVRIFLLTVFLTATCAIFSSCVHTETSGGEESSFSSSQSDSSDTSSDTSSDSSSDGSSSEGGGTSGGGLINGGNYEAH